MRKLLLRTAVGYPDHKGRVEICDIRHIPGRTIFAACCPSNPYSPGCVEGVFAELWLEGVLGSPQPRSRVGGPRGTRGRRISTSPGSRIVTHRDTVRAL